MKVKFRKVALVGLYADTRVAEPMRLISEYLSNAGIDVMADPEHAANLAARAVDGGALTGEADLIIAVGGDGTMLHAASLTKDADVPLLGINRGRLGFLSDVSPDQMLESLDQILSGNFSMESRLRLTATIVRHDADNEVRLALNDVVLQRRDTGRILDFETRINGNYVNTHMADGLIVATPTGSTAYALSCGGPIIEPPLAAVVVVPICPHTLSDRPVVIPADQDIEVTLLPREGTRAEISVDGHSMGAFNSGYTLHIKAARNPVTLIHPPGYDYYEILRSKLHWGRDSRIRNLGSRD
ncbi:MAG: NAD(+) kinase [Woeseiaceae bacterium]